MVKKPKANLRSVVSTSDYAHELIKMACIFHGSPAYETIDHILSDYMNYISVIPQRRPEYDALMTIVIKNSKAEKKQLRVKKESI